MPPTDGERLASLEEQMRGLRGDVAEQLAESQRTRERLHTLEATTQGFKMDAEYRERERVTRERKQTRVLQVLTVVVAAAAVAEPFLYHLAQS